MLREIALLVPDIQVEVTLLGPGMVDHPSSWITHEGLTVNGIKGLYHDLLPQPALDAEDENLDASDDTAAKSEKTEEADPEAQAEGTKKHHSKKKNKQKTVILAGAGVAACELAPPVRPQPDPTPLGQVSLRESSGSN